MPGKTLVVYKKKRKGHHKASKLKSTVSKMIRTVVGRPEMKIYQTYDSAFTVTNDPTSAAAIIPPIPPVRGSDVSTRGSDKIILRGWEIRIWLIGSSALQSAFALRMMFMKWRNVDNATAPNPLQYLPVITAGIQSVITAPHSIGSNCATDKGKKSFSILKDRLITMAGQEVTAAASPLSTVGGNQISKCYTFKFRFPQGIPVNFTGNTASPSAILDNWLNFQIWASATPACTCTAMQSVYWTDCA